jgi:hypothetical protein
LGMREIGKLVINFRHYKPNRFTVEKRYGVALEIHPKRKTLDVYFGRHVFVWWVGRSY